MAEVAEQMPKSFIFIRALVLLAAVLGDLLSVTRIAFTMAETGSY